MADVLIVLAVAIVAGLVGAGLGIFLMAPRLSRLTERLDDEGARDGDD